MKLWSAIVALGTGIPTATKATIAGMAMANPVAAVATIMGALISLAGALGLAYYGKKTKPQ